MRIDSVDATQLGDLREPLHELYRQCFADPPWNEPQEMLDDYVNVLAKHLERPGLSGSVAVGDAGLLGVVYGWPMPPELPDDTLHRAVARVVPTERLVAPAVAVVELMVNPVSRGRGVGRALLDHFVCARDAWLVTHPDALACRLYKSAGWRPSAQFRNQYGDRRVAYVLSSGAT
ncbi:GNAT family N-acetyltransferase [Kibdelosporangium aridum]|uniref:Acetyltransferase (GNAT) family protein n=1 Tax=Kibdelosporangium aridum TaxID=2030 RepID=A0A1Y5X0S2_KIBAR|nr:GNAT family N-acetyltransferase [Kibdelosporangium aridum]SMC58289.1 Acetyltransferase (GNAT) family protein [Kibdelosporangium aridum]